MSEDPKSYTTTPPPSKREELEKEILHLITGPVNFEGASFGVRVAQRAELTKAICDLIESREKELREKLHFATNLFMEEQEKYFAMKREVRRVAIGFAEWIGYGWHRTFFTDDDRLWSNEDYPDSYTTSELYNLYTQSKTTDDGK